MNHTLTTSKASRATDESSGVLRVDHVHMGVSQATRIFNMRLADDRDAFIRFASWASSHSVTFTATAL